MKKQKDNEAAETVKITETQAVAQQRLVQLLPCPFCGSEAEITDESMPDRPRTWFFAWCKNRPECNCWLADGSPEKVAGIWNRRSGRESTA
jgi:transposase-like protein